MLRHFAFVLQKVNNDMELCLLWKSWLLHSHFCPVKYCVFVVCFQICTFLKLSCIISLYFHPAVVPAKEQFISNAMSSIARSIAWQTRRIAAGFTPIVQRVGGLKAHLLQNTEGWLIIIISNSVNRVSHCVCLSMVEVSTEAKPGWRMRRRHEQGLMMLSHSTLEGEPQVSSKFFCFVIMTLFKQYKNVICKWVNCACTYWEWSNCALFRSVPAFFSSRNVMLLLSF